MATSLLPRISLSGLSFFCTHMECIHDQSQAEAMTIGGGGRIHWHAIHCPQVRRPLTLLGS